MVSPVLSNIYLHKLDVYVETVLASQYTRGKHRRPNPEYERIKARMARARARGDRDHVRHLRRQLQQLPSVDPQDPGYRRLKYTRYADDHLLGFIGPKAEAEAIRDQLALFLRDDLALELNPDKTLVTHARTRAARYLGYEIIVQHCDEKVTNGRRSINGTVALRVPLDVVDPGGLFATRRVGCSLWPVLMVMIFPVVGPSPLRAGRRMGMSCPCSLSPGRSRIR